jgi:hypothetical protein
MAPDIALTAGSIWRAKSVFTAIEAIRIVSEAENRRSLLVEWIGRGLQVQMRADVVLSDYTPAEDVAVGLLAG